MRRAFDRAFALPSQRDDTPTEDFLAIGVDEQAIALRLSDVTGLFTGRKIMRLPSQAPALLGIAGFRGGILPVYDLGMLLGRPAAESPRWLVIAKGAAVALAFDGFHGHRRISKAAILAHEDAGRAGYAREYLRSEGAVRPIVHLPSILDAIKAAAHDTVPGEELPV
jgi:purine-binding chemotaxis protein CheW